MDRTFHQRLTIGAICGIILMLSLAIYAFWIKSVILGIVMVFFLIIITERSLHSEYVFHDNKLIIRHGRLSKDKTIFIGSITSCRPMASVFGLVRYLLISYGSGYIVSVQPDNEQAFIEVLKKKKLREDKNEELDN